MRKLGKKKVDFNVSLEFNDSDYQELFSYYQNWQKREGLSEEAQNCSFEDFVKRCLEENSLVLIFATAKMLSGKEKID